MTVPAPHSKAWAEIEETIRRARLPMPASAVTAHHVRELARHTRDMFRPSVRVSHVEGHLFGALS